MSYSEQRGTQEQGNKFILPKIQFKLRKYPIDPSHPLAREWRRSREQTSSLGLMNI